MLKSSRNSLDDGAFLLCKLDSFDDFACSLAFDCGDEDLNEFFHCDAQPHKQELLAEIYCLKLKEATGSEPSLPVAFISFSNDAIPTAKTKNFKAFKEYLEHSIPAQKVYHYLPAVKIGRIGVDKRYQKQSLGTYLINLTKRLFTTDNRTGCRFVTVDAYNRPEVIKFYNKNHFQFLHDDDSTRPTRIMYFDLKRFQA
ncbi:MAG: GNAT family N-acetyltransferase [Desulfobacteraceae bacterium]|nr:MAG: GNAT family N-acetyltransferase [Desulfobacteraceae bacterium]